MNFIKRSIDELTLHDNKIFGNKATYLAEAKRNGVNVLGGICIVIDVRKGLNLVKIKETIEKEFETCFRNQDTYIVRSSAQNEDGKEYAYAGIFESKGNIRGKEELVTAIQECYMSLFSEKAKLYMVNIGLKKMHQNYFCILIQKQFNPKYSGVLFVTDEYKKRKYSIEMTKGHCKEILIGKQKANAYLIERCGKQIIIKEFFSFIDIEKNILDIVFYQLCNEIDKIVDILGDNLDVEWGYKDGQVIIFQIRPISIEKNSKTAEIANPEYSFYGIKANAMKKFYEIGLFQKELLVISAGTKLKEVVCMIKEKWIPDSQITVRFSCGEKLGLPRYFAYDRKSAIEFIEKNYNDDWAIIIHESIEVKHSYEMYVDNEKAILEHMPGMWESDNRLSTDVWIYKGKEVKAKICKNIRRAKYEIAEEIKYEDFFPYKKNKTIDIAKEIETYVNNIRNGWNCEKGLIFHFVRDKEGKIFFLNIRKSKRIFLCEEYMNRITEINSKEDIYSWDGKSDVLLKINLKRGEEDLLKEYVPYFKKFDSKVYVEFGILSHPAILLREMGVKVYPIYSVHNEYEFKLED